MLKGLFLYEVTTYVRVCNVFCYSSDMFRTFCSYRQLFNASLPVYYQIVYSWLPDCLSTAATGLYSMQPNSVLFSCTTVYVGLYSWFQYKLYSILYSGLHSGLIPTGITTCNTACIPAHIPACTPACFYNTVPSLCNSALANTVWSHSPSRLSKQKMTFFKNQKLTNTVRSQIPRCMKQTEFKKHKTKKENIKFA